MCKKSHNRIGSISDVKITNSPSLLGAVGHGEQVSEGPDAVDYGGHNDAPAPVDARAQDPRGEEGRRNVSDVLVAGPEAKHQAAALGGEPVAHNGRVHLSFVGWEGSWSEIFKVRYGDILKYGLTGPPVAWKRPCSSWQERK